MAQVTVDNLDTLEKLKNDPVFRKEFLSNTGGFMKANGFPVTEETLDGVIKKQLEGLSKLPPGSVASTAVIITIF